ncbi:MAG: sulfite exporter TauE/SafE family protein [Azospirillaceae bacterium]|nr:sulfite exporter TauE/SafE family protein [Azospirillaceae bacterium]
MVDAATAFGLLQVGLDHCQIVLDRHVSLVAALFTAGLVGGTSHCAGMCGPFVLAQVSVRLQQVPAAGMREWHRVRGAAVLPYHLGRATTYTALGAVSAGIAGGAVATLPGLRGVETILLLAAALFFLAAALKGVAGWLPDTGRFTRRVPALWAEHVAAIARPLFASPTGGRGYLLGLALGFIPCGLLYGALAAAAATGSALGGAVAMAAFALGTLPALFAVGLAGHLAGRRFMALARRIAPLIMAGNAVVLGAMAWRLMI